MDNLSTTSAADALTAARICRQAKALGRAIKHFNGKTALARALNARGHGITSHNTVAQWEKTRTPAEYCPDIEVLTGVTCEELREDIAWGLLRVPATEQSSTGA